MAGIEVTTYGRFCVNRGVTRCGDGGEDGLLAVGGWAHCEDCHGPLLDGRNRVSLMQEAGDFRAEVPAHQGMQIDLRGQSSEPPRTIP